MESPDKQPGRPPRVAILVVNGFDRRGRWGEFNEQEAREFPWIRLCIQQIKRHTRRVPYEILVWDNARIREQRRWLKNQPRVRTFGPRIGGGREKSHGHALDLLVQEVSPDTEFVITMDTDAFPVRDGWMDNILGRLHGDVQLAGVWRDELVPARPAFIHPCCLAIRLETLKLLDTGFPKGETGRDVGHRVNMAVEAAGGHTSRLYRSNRWNPHYLMGALYGDLIYHQGAGSRAPMFSGGSGEHAEHIRTTLRDLAFSDLDRLIKTLAGNLSPEGIPALAALEGVGSPA
jgi:hypothetical protein